MDRNKRGFALMAAALLAVSGWAAPVTLDQALGLAKERNGAVLAAKQGVVGARSAVREAQGAFLPTVTPTFRYDATEIERFTGVGLGSGSGASGSSFDVTASVRLLDSGERQFRLASSKSRAAAEQATALLTLRQTLFSVIQGYYNGLRAVDLLRVQTAQLERADLILKQTRARAEVGDIARKDILQAEADQLNARVAALTAQSRVKTSLASLKASIGWSEQEGPLELAPLGDAAFVPTTMTFEQAVELALRQRPDLAATRSQVDAQRQAVRLARAEAGIGVTVDATFTRSFARDVFNRSGVGLVASFPLFDGRRSLEGVIQAESTLKAQQARLTQDERDVRSEVEQAYTENQQNALRLEAAQAALAAARKNFEAASRSQALQAATLVEVVQAQASLVTAEVNAVEVLYDALISDARLQLAIGNPMRGEENAPRG